MQAIITGNPNWGDYPTLTEKLNKLFPPEKFANLNLYSGVRPGAELIAALYAQENGHVTLVDMARNEGEDPLKHADRIIAEAQKTAARQKSPNNLVCLVVFGGENDIVSRHYCVVFEDIDLGKFIRRITI